MDDVVGEDVDNVVVVVGAKVVVVVAVDVEEDVVDVITATCSQSAGPLMQVLQPNLFSSQLEYIKQTFGKEGSFSVNQV